MTQQPSQDMMAAAVANAQPAVVRACSQGHRTATGFAIAPDLVVTTAAVCVDDLELLTDDGVTAAATVVGVDPATDVALLRASSLQLAPLAAAETEHVAVGRAVVALGRPGQVIRASSRIIGVVGPTYHTRRGGTLDSYIETDRQLPRGFSGGPLLTTDGRVVGMNTRSLVRGADICVPMPTVERVVEHLSRHGRVPQGRLGVAAFRVALPAELQQQLGRKSGALVLSVADGSAASAGGVLLGDVVVAVDEQPVVDPSALRRALASRDNRPAVLHMIRAGELTELPVDIGEWQ